MSDCVRTVPLATARVMRAPCARPIGSAPHASEAFAGPRRLEVGDGQHVDAGGAASLGELHRAELAGADQHQAQRPALSVPLKQQAMQVHGQLAGRRPTAHRLPALRFIGRASRE